MFVLGIDPGLTRCGYGVLARDGAGSFTASAAGTIETDRSTSVDRRLCDLAQSIRELLVQYDPAVVVVERVFFQTNAKTAIGVAQASGIALSCAAAHGCEVAQYTSNEVKLAVVGYGSATKTQVQSMVARQLRLTATPPPDAADALALAMCHLVGVSMRRAVKLAGLRS